MFLGIAGLKDHNGDIQVGLGAHDCTYSVDFTTRHFSHDELEKDPSGSQTYIMDYILSEINSYQHEHRCKFLGAGIEKAFNDTMCPGLCSALWARLDILPMVFRPTAEYPQTNNSKTEYTVSEHADSMARKCVM
jgi:alpha,alpha-trehalose phosphorylase (configuration-retaining)